MNELDFGFRVRTRRRFLGISQDDLGKAVGISQVAIRKIEAGGQTRHGRKIAVKLNTSLRWLETGVDPTVDGDGSFISGATDGTHQQSDDSPHPTAAPPWPFKKSTAERIQALPPAQVKKIDDMIDAVLTGLEAGAKSGA